VTERPEPQSGPEEPAGGDPVCWAHLLCPECGAFLEPPDAERCPRCGADLPAEDR
jgi:ribosomal protein S27AE